MTNSGSTLSIGIAGAGLLGRLLAWRLLLAGHRVTLFEATRFSQPRSAANSAAAMISPYGEIVQSDRLIFDWGLRALSLWPQWIAALNNACAEPVAYTANGSIALAHPQDVAELQQFKQDLQYRLGSDDRSQWLRNAQLREWEPAVGHFETGLLLPDEASLDNRHLLHRLLECVQSLGGTCIDNTPITVGNHCCMASDARYEFDWALDCRGMGARDVMPTLRGVRGELLWVETRELQLHRPLRLMHPRYKLYIVPKPNNRFVIGATEIESEDQSPISLQSTLELASALYSIHPAFAEARVIETDSNLRPALLDNNPRLEVAPGLIRVNGLYRHGYLLAPPIVENVLRFVQGETPDTPWTTCSEEAVA